jgi:hypothetical protein
MKGALIAFAFAVGIIASATLVSRIDGPKCDANSLAGPRIGGVIRIEGCP